MEFLKKNAKKLAGLLALSLAVAAGAVSMKDGCGSTVQGLLEAKSAVEKVEPLLPGDELPEGVKE